MHGLGNRRDKTERERENDSISQSIHCVCLSVCALSPNLGSSVQKMISI